MCSLSGQEISIYDQQPQAKESLIPSNIYTTLHATNNLSSVHTLCGITANKIALSTKHTPKSHIAESNPDVTSDLLDIYFSATKDAGSCVSGSLSTGNRSVDGAIEEKSGDGNRGRREQEQGGKGDTKQGKNNTEQEGRLGDIHKQDVEEKGSTREVTGRLAGRAQTHEHGQGSTEYVRDTRKPETETKDRAERERRDGEEKRERTAVNIQETEIPAQTFSDKNHRDGEKSNTLQAIDSTNTESLLADSSQSLSQTVNENDADCSHVNEGYRSGMKGNQLHTLNADEIQNLSHGIHPLSHEVQCFSHNGVQTFTHDVDSLNQSSDIIQKVCQKTPEEKPLHTTAEDFHGESSEPLNQSNICSTQTTAALSASQSDNVVNMKKSEATDIQLEDCNPSNNTINRKNTEDQPELHTSEKCVSVKRTVKPHETLEISEQENGQLKALESDSGACEKQNYQSKINLGENDASETDHSHNGKLDVKDGSPLNGSCVDIRMDILRLFDSQEETGSFQEPMKNDDAKTTESEIDLQRSAPRNDENDASSEFLCSKCDKQPVAKQLLLSNTDDSSLPSNKKFRSTFELHSAQRKTASCRTEQKSDVSSFHGLGQVLRLKS